MAVSSESQAAHALDIASDGLSALAGTSGLWASAIGKLTPAQLEMIAADGQIELKTVIVSAYKEAEGVQKRLGDNRTKIKIRGKEHTLYSIWAKILVEIKTFESFISSIVKLDGSGHAALPWAAIRLILKVGPPSLSLEPSIF
jgi:hypothetical protein